MKIFVDADSFPKPARETVLRASSRTGIQVVFVANRPIPGIKSNTAIMEICPNEDGAADDRIFDLACPGDLVLTRDVPLANRLVLASILVLDDRGKLYTKENIRERLSIRNFMVGLAENGMGIERHTTYGKRELKSFADSFDRIMTKLIRETTVKE